MKLIMNLMFGVFICALTLFVASLLCQPIVTAQNRPRQTPQASTVPLVGTEAITQSCEDYYNRAQLLGEYISAPEAASALQYTKMTAYATMYLACKEHSKNVRVP